MEVDYSGLEVRIAACYHKDTTMLHYIKDPTTDMHTDMARQIFMVDNYDKNIPEHYVLRQAVKNGFVFPEFYGDYYGNCAIGMACTWGKLGQGKWHAGEGIPMPKGTLGDHFISKGIKSLEDFSNHVKAIEADFWGNRFAEYAEWKERWYSTYKKYGYVDLLTGFRCSGVMDRKQVINYPVQGAAFHCNLYSFIEADRAMRRENWDTKIVGQIHDSIVLDVNPKELIHVVETLKTISTVNLPKAWDWIIVPLEVDFEVAPVDGSWAEKAKYKD
jgi:DNA polymerase I-like protein with 3'-5' exonuclease and polymerase domains